MTDISKIETMKEIIAKSKSIVKEIIGSTKKKGILNEFWKKHINEERENGRIITMNSLSMPGPTRWTGILEMLSNLIKNRVVLRMWAIDEYKGNELSEENKVLILSDMFWRELDVYKEFISPIISGIKMFDGFIALIWIYLINHSLSCRTLDKELSTQRI